MDIDGLLNIVRSIPRDSDGCPIVMDRGVVILAHEVLLAALPDWELIDVSELDYSVSVQFYAMRPRDSRLRQLNRASLHELASEVGEVCRLAVSVSCVSNFVLVEPTLFTVSGGSLHERTLESSDTRILQAISDLDAQFRSRAFQILPLEALNVTVPGLVTELNQSGTATVGNALFFG